MRVFLILVVVAVLCFFIFKALKKEEKVTLQLGDYENDWEGLANFLEEKGYQFEYDLDAKHFTLFRTKDGEPVLVCNFEDVAEGFKKLKEYFE